MMKYRNGGPVGPKKGPKTTKLTKAYVEQQEGFAKKQYEQSLKNARMKSSDGKISQRDKSDAEIAALKNAYVDLDYSKLSPQEKQYVEKHQKEMKQYLSSPSVFSAPMVNEDVTIFQVDKKKKYRK